MVLEAIGAAADGTGEVYVFTGFVQMPPFVVMTVARASVLVSFAFAMLMFAAYTVFLLARAVIERV